MSNRLKMAKVDLILRLSAQRWSQRRIAAELEVDRKAVSRYVRMAAQNAHSAGPQAPTGSEPGDPGRLRDRRADPHAGSPDGRCQAAQDARFPVRAQP